MDTPETNPLGEIAPRSASEPPPAAPRSPADYGNLPIYHVPAPAIQDVYVPNIAWRRRRLLPLVLFLLACCTTFAAGVAHWNGDFIEWKTFSHELAANWPDGLKYMVGVIGILLAHEMGHFLMAVYHDVPASFPYFIPVPLLLTGTMGAVIRMQGARADRKQIFDIGIAGPLAGLVVAVPILIVGILQAQLIPVAAAPGSIRLGNPLIVDWLVPLLRPEAASAGNWTLNVQSNPWAMAAWLGMLLSGLNMMPVSQLDGGHVIYGLFGPSSRKIARAFLISVIGYMIVTDNFFWLVMVIFVVMIGVDHPPTANDRVELGRTRRILGWLSLAIPVLCFTPLPFIEG
ncbi:MAG TPA: site-2 protease family protein [Pirellulales bacterium]|jgi:membrane-associated protease RseP (regulator of RpoE activity)|nr:site-2 protease family protein [Pirellulales bacterium]